jgi:hypothetical protein
MLLLKGILAKNKNMPKRKSSRSTRPDVRRPVAKRKSANARSSRLFLPWPLVTFILLSIGVLLVGWTFQAEADDIHVTAKISAPLPSGPAVITSPGDGTHFSDVPITVSGTCPSDTYIKLYRNDFFSGTVLCTTDGNFSLDTDLFPGANKLDAKIFNLTDDEGPAGVPITVYYDVPEQPSGGGTQPQPSTGTQSSSSAQTPAAPSAVPLTIKSDYGYRGYKVGQTIEWTFEINGGIPPYAVNIDWGDGTNTLLSQKQPGKVNVSHRYKKVGNGTNGSYKVKATASDSEGRKTFMQLFLIIVPSGVPGFVSNTLPSGPRINSSWLKLIWPAYLVVILMAASFWLGEREELTQLRHRRPMRRRHI